MTQIICHNFYNRALEELIEPFDNETPQSKQKLISTEGRKNILINNMQEYFEDLELNPKQIALTVCYFDSFLSELAEKECRFNFSLIKSVTIISCTIAYKMTNDFAYSNKSLQDYFKIKNLSQLESDYCELIGYKLHICKEKVAEYLQHLIE